MVFILIGKETEAFFTQCVQDGDGYLSKVKFVNKELSDNGFRHFKVESADNAFTPDRIKFYRPKQNITTKR